MISPFKKGDLVKVARPFYHLHGGEAYQLHHCLAHQSGSAFKILDVRVKDQHMAYKLETNDLIPNSSIIWIYPEYLEIVFPK